MEFDFSNQPGLYRKNVEIFNKTPLMSIITPFYNAGKYFEQTFNCVMNQTFIWFEWIIVNDGSTNAEDVRLLENLCKTDTRIKIYHIKNSGPAAARNYAVEKTGTEIIVSLDADDLIEPVYLEQTYFALYFHPEAAWAYTDSLGFGELEYVWKVHFDSERLKKRNFLIEIGTFRKKIFEKAGGYDAAQKHSHEDWNLWLRMMGKGGYPVHISSLSAWYRIVNNGALHQTNDNKTVRKRALQRIKDTAKSVPKHVEAIEYPRKSNVGEYNIPKNFESILVKEKSKREVLMLLSTMGKNENNLMNLELVKKIDQRKVHIGIMTTEVADSSLTQQFSQYVDDLFELSSFLDIKNYAEYISFYLKSRKVDVIYINESSYAYYLVPWIKTEFPEIALIDCSIFYNSIEDVNKLRNCSEILENYLSHRYFVQKENAMYELEELAADLEKEFFFYKKENELKYEEEIRTMSNLVGMLYNEVIALETERKCAWSGLKKIDKIYKTYRKWEKHFQATIIYEYICELKKVIFKLRGRK